MHILPSGSHSDIYSDHVAQIIVPGDVYRGAKARCRNVGPQWLETA
jgi:hypothetical protein